MRVAVLSAMESDDRRAEEVWGSEAGRCEQTHVASPVRHNTCYRGVVVIFESVCC
ncbi:MAG: hypothetical protein BJ554DRAFT_2234 [Olpidium bornovanus]|uniref:Uncharacterized protein n=1 Tax=Olpidium bornovanus TaxID=278681 RepID=A0A8H8DGG9_9FUNG|nr:MAG: hypothetical protein BJ554DRAFT_2234 [Olpidium bornovanus]